VIPRPQRREYYRTVSPLARIIGAATLAVATAFAPLTDARACGYASGSPSNACWQRSCQYNDLNGECVCGTSETTCPDDGDPCTVERCVDPEGCIREPYDCSDHDPCTVDTCIKGYAPGMVVPECAHTVDPGCSFANRQYRRAQLDALEGDAEPEDGCSVMAGPGTGAAGTGALAVLAALVLARHARRRSRT
jgi:MYXO-CTERM domain-containing protein